MEIDMAKLIGPGISVKQHELAKYTMANLIRVDPHVGRDRGIVALPTKQFGLKPDKLGEKGKGFYSNHLEAGHLCLIPEENRKALDRHEARLRNSIKAAEVADRFIPVASFDNVKRQYEQIRQEYLAQRDLLISMWESLVKDFYEGSMEMLKGIRMKQRDRQVFHQAIMKGLPSKERFQNSFYMKLDISAFPASGAPEGLEESLAAAVEESSKNNLYSFALQAIEQTVGKAFSLLGQAYASYEKVGFASGKTLEGMARLQTDIGFKNVFNNPCISAIQNSLDKIYKEHDADSRQELVEDCILDVWAYAKQTGIRVDPDVMPVSSSDLDAMLVARETAKSNQICMAM